MRRSHLKTRGRKFGKDEVPSSNLGSSSKEKPRNLNGSGVFMFRQTVSKHPKFTQILGGIMGGVNTLWGA
nr:MAG TPA: hypothetical protein [Caudoviricetes sp.]